MNYHWLDKLKKAGAEVIRTEAICRANPISWSACGPVPGTPEGDKYIAEAAAHRAAEAEFWMLTDCEYDDDDPYKACWEWRYWKVQARKCCWYQLKQPLLGSRKAGGVMRKLQEVEEHLFAVLGLADEYKSPCEYIEEAFPNLKKKG
jgi:hypothetical protein